MDLNGAFEWRQFGSGIAGVRNFLKFQMPGGLPREEMLKLRFDFEIPSKIKCRLYFIYSLFMFSVFFPVMPQAIKTTHPGRIGLNLNKLISFFWHAKSDNHFINKAAVTLSKIVARK